MTDEQLIKLNGLSSHVGRFVQHFGFKKIHGQVWTHIYLSSAPITAQHLIQRLKVSKALISLTLKDLIDHNVIHEVPGSVKIKKYIANKEIMTLACDNFRIRELKMLEDLRKEFRLLKALPRFSELETQRMAKLELLIDYVIEGLDNTITSTCKNLELFAKFDS